MAHTTGTTRFIFDRMMRIVSSAVRSGISREGAIVPVTTTMFSKYTKQNAISFESKDLIFVLCVHFVVV